MMHATSFDQIPLDSGSIWDSEFPKTHVLSASARRLGGVDEAELECILIEIDICHKEMAHISDSVLASWLVAQLM
jgi:hypothetical protein